MGWVVNATPQPLYPRERRDTHCTGGWVGPGPVWIGAENLAPTGIRSPDRPARSMSLYRLGCPVHAVKHKYALIYDDWILHAAYLNFKRRIKSHLPFAGIIRSSPYSSRFQGNG